MSQHHHKTGFTLLFASLIVSLLLAVGLAILNITLQQILLSSAAKESQYAFYNADTGLECAIYADKVGKGFATSSTEVGGHITQPSDISCQIVPNTPAEIKSFDGPYQNTDGNTETDFEMIWQSLGQCPNTNGMDKLVKIQAIKIVDPNSGDVTTNILARGYNSCDPNNNRRLERGFGITY